MIIVTTAYTVKKDQARHIIEKRMAYSMEEIEGFLGQEVLILDEKPDCDEVIFSMRFLSKHAADRWQEKFRSESRTSERIIGCKTSSYEIKTPQN